MREFITRRVLVISYHYPPDGAVGGLRWSGLSKFLARLGWEVHIVTAALRSGELPVEGVHVHECPRGRTLNERYAEFARRRRARRKNELLDSMDATITRDRSLRVRISDGLRMVARIALAFPDDGRGWVLRAARTGRALHTKHPFDAVITSGPPHSAHFAGLLVALGNSAMRRIIDLRDPWRGVNKSFPQYGMDPNWIYPLIALLEPVLFRFAHKVIVNTREFAKELQSARPQLSIVHVSNGIDLETLPTRTAERFDGISIAYVGTFYAGRSFGTVISALKAVSRDRPNEASRITLRIAGQIDSGHRDQLRASLAQDGLEGSLEFLGNIPRPDALDLLRRSHLALVLAQNQRTQIPAKLYECVGLSVPTLVISETDSAASREARRIGAIAVDPDDATRIQEVLNSLLDGTFPATLTAATPISYELLAAKVDQIIGEGGDQRRMGTPSLRSIERFGDVH